MAKLSKLHIERMMQQQHGRCYYCTKPMTPYKRVCTLAQRRDMATQDHLIPESKGGLTAVANIRLTCCRCNELKNDMFEEEFRLLIKQCDGSVDKVERCCNRSITILRDKKNDLRSLKRLEAAYGIKEIN